MADARSAARRARELIRTGLDPIEHTRAEANARRAEQSKNITFQEAAQAYIAAHELGWRNAKHAQQWRNTLAEYAYPVIGPLLVRDIELTHVLAVLIPIWSKKTETAKRLRARIEQVLDWATVRGHREGLNPARWKGHLDKQLPRPSKIMRVKHHAALPLAEVGAFMARLREVDGLGARALEFAILTAARSGRGEGSQMAGDRHE